MFDFRGAGGLRRFLRGNLAHGGGVAAPRRREEARGEAAASSRRTAPAAAAVEAVGGVSLQGRVV